MNTEEFFDWGCPTEYNNIQIGLWQPSLDQFLLVLCDVAMAEQLKLIASPRYDLFVCKLNSADNYFHNLVDNSCCENWTLSNKKDINTSNISLFADPIEVKHLNHSMNSNWNIQQEKNWLQMCWFWLKFLNHLKSYHGKWYYYDRFVKKIWPDSSLPRGDYYNNIDTVETHIYKTLYFGQDLNLAHSDIKQFIIDNDATISDIWSQWESTTRLNL
jgi:hypothetical protein